MRFHRLPAYNKVRRAASQPTAPWGARGCYSSHTMGISWQELILVLVIVLVLFGPKRLPEVGRSLGNGIREFRDTMSGHGPTSSPIEAEATKATTTPAARVAEPAEPVVDADSSSK